MAFTFQINDDVAFTHNKKFIDKSNSFKPELKHEKVGAVEIVNLIEDKTALEGVGVQRTQNIQSLNQLELRRNDKIILDFGNHYVGHFSINVNSKGSPMDAPLAIKVKFAEVPAELAHKSEDYDGWLSKSWIQEEYIHLDVLPAKLALPRRYSFRYVEITVVDTSPKWVATFDNPIIETDSVVKSDEVKVPQLKDPKIEKIYQVGLKTLEDCMQDVFEDGPKRDRRLWIGDLRLQALSNYATFEDIDLVKRCLYLFGAMPATDGRIPANIFTEPTETPDDTFLFDYSLFFIAILADYEEFNRDEVMLNDLYPIAKSQINYAIKQINDKGKLVLTEDYPVFIDWSNDFDKSTAGQAVLIYALKRFIKLAELVNDSDIEVYKQQLDLITQYATDNLFDESKGLFVSGENREFNIASQVWMTLAYVFDDNKTMTLMKNTVKQLFPIKGIATPYMYHHIAQALFEAGLTDEGVSLLKSYWGKMIDLGADAYWEAFDPNKPDYSPYGSPIINSYCHAWSCTPVYLINKYLL